MNKNAIIAIVAAVVVVAAGAAVAVFMMNDGDDSETYYFYISNEAKDIKGWHSGNGHDAAEGFADAMKKDNIEFTIEGGYLSKIGSVTGFVYSAMYLYSNTSKLAANASIGDMGGVLKGWKDISGYDKTDYTGDKVAEMDSHVYFYSFYEAVAPWGHPTPDSDKGWMTTGPFEKEIKLNDKKQTYNFYISSTDKAVQGWHSASGNNAAEAFETAMNDAKIAFEINESGYIGKIGNDEGYYYVAQYVYTDYDKEAADASIGDMSGLLKGWNDISGYDIGTGKQASKFSQFEGNSYFISMYEAVAPWGHPTPDSDKGWMTTGPFSN